MKKIFGLLFLVLIFAVNFSGCVPAASKSVDSENLKDQLITDKEDADDQKEVAPIVSEATLDTAEPSNVSDVNGESAEVKLAKCLAEKDIKLYTSRTCPHCTTQKEMFKDGLQYLSNIDCLKADSSGWSDVCTGAGIDRVPTWIFPNADKVTGTTALNILAEKAGCEYNP